MNNSCRKPQGFFPFELTKFFDEVLNDVVTGPQPKRKPRRKSHRFNGRGPAVNIIEADNQYLIEVSAPGWKKEDFEVKIEGDFLTISAQAQKEVVKEDTSEDTTNTENTTTETPKTRFVKREFSKRSFSRTFTMTDNLNKEAIDATYESGILTITIDKAEEETPEKRIVEIS